MDNNFESLIARFLTEYGPDILDNRSRCRALLNDWAKGDFKRETRLFLTAIEAGCNTKILLANETWRQLPLTIIVGQGYNCPLNAGGRRIFLRSSQLAADV
jgi:hypothetical protein